MEEGDDKPNNIEVSKANIEGWDEHAKYWRTHESHLADKKMNLHRKHYLAVFSEIESLSGGCDNKVVADVGCAAGTEMDWMFLEKGCSSFVGIDISKQMLLWFNHKIIDTPSYPKVSLVVASAEFLPFSKDAFDEITCIHTLHHCPRPEIALMEMERTSKGFILLEPNRESVIHKLSHRVRSIGKHNFSMTKFSERLVEIHDLGFTAKEIKATIRKYQNIRSSTIGIIPHALLVPKRIGSIAQYIERLIRKLPILKNQLGSILIVAA